MAVLLLQPLHQGFVVPDHVIKNNDWELGKADDLRNALDDCDTFEILLNQ